MFRLVRALLLIATVIISSVGIVPPAPSPAIAAPTTWYVSNTGNDANSCSSPAQPCATIQAAVDKASDGDTVKVALGTYAGTANEAVLLSVGITLSGGWNSSFIGQSGLSVIDGQSARGGIRTDSNQTILIDNFQISYSGNSKPGVYITQGKVNITDSDISNNSNLSNYGGGIVNFGVLNLLRSSITKNRAYGGGGIVNSGSVVIENSTIGNNTATFGGGIINSTGASSVIIRSSTISKNVASVGGGLTTNYALATYSLQNSILAGNSPVFETSYAYECYGAIESLGYNIIGSAPGSSAYCSFTPTTGDQIEVNPQLGPLVGKPAYFPLAATSPAINGGNPSGCFDNSASLITIDQRSVNRSNRCDIGAYEFINPTSPASLEIIAGNAQTATIQSLYQVPLQVVSLDTAGTPVTNTIVNFSAPSQGASGVFSSTTAITITAISNSNGVASTSLFANSIPGTFTVTAKLNNVITPSVFSLTNLYFGQLFFPTLARNYCPNFFDDFSQNRGWFTIDSNLRRVELLNGEYRSLSKQSGYLFLYRAPTCSRENYTVEVDARWAQTGSDLGLIFGDNGDYGNFYFFDINSDFQAFILLRYSGGAYTTLAGPAQTGAINPGTQNNKLKVIRNGTAISLYANNILLGTWYDGAIAGLTHVGLATSPYDDVPVSDARFDNFNVTGNYANGASLPSLEPASTTAVSRPLPASINWQPQLNLKVVEQP